MIWKWGRNCIFVSTNFEKETLITMEANVDPKIIARISEGKPAQFFMRAIVTFPEPLYKNDYFSSIKTQSDGSKAIDLMVKRADGTLASDTLTYEVPFPNGNPIPNDDDILFVHILDEAGQELGNARLGGGGNNVEIEIADDGSRPWNKVDRT